MTPIMELAIRVARAAPTKRGSYVHAANIPWSLIEELRDTLDQAGIEWRSAIQRDRTVTQ